MNKMLTIKEAKREIMKYESIYRDAVMELWNFDELISGQNVRFWLMSQIVQESRSNPQTKSPVGAIGLAQFMPTTAKEAGGELKELYPQKFKDGFNPLNAEQSIYAQVWYMNKLFTNWHSKRTPVDRFMLACASYNAGLGNILKAQRKMGGAINWMDIRRGLERVTGKQNSKETKNYVKRIIDVGLVW